MTLQRVVASLQAIVRTASVVVRTTNGGKLDGQSFESPEAAAAAMEAAGLVVVNHMGDVYGFKSVKDRNDEMMGRASGLAVAYTDEGSGWA